MYMIIMRRTLYILIFSILGVATANAQNAKFALSTNALDWANYGTANLELGVGVAQHLSLQAGVKYNPWEFTAKDLDIPVRNNQTTAFVGVRWWPWYVLSGWWVGAKVQYSDYEKTGVWRPALENGVKVGGGLSFGYTLMVHKHINIEFGAGMWGGSQLKYDLYCCTKCMEVRSTGKRGFFGLDDASVSLMFVF
jgi:hypothetical protein